MAMDPFRPFLDGDNTFIWNSFSPMEMPSVDFAAGSSDMLMVLESPTEPEFLTMAQRSAFLRYAGSSNAGMMECKAGGAGQVMHKRVIEMLRKIPRSDEGNRGVEVSRGFRHMMRERQRREKLSQSYANLYSLISARSKSDKNSIVQSATAYARELKEVKDALQKCNEELKRKVLQSSENNVSKIKICVANPTSSIDSMIVALKCLKSMDVKARAIKSDLTSREFSAIMSINTKIAADEMERTVEVALREVEKKLQCQLLGISSSSKFLNEPNH